MVLGHQAREGPPTGDDLRRMPTQQQRDLLIAPSRYGVLLIDVLHDRRKRARRTVMKGLDALAVLLRNHPRLIRVVQPGEELALEAPRLRRRRLHEPRAPEPLADAPLAPD